MLYRFFGNVGKQPDQVTSPEVFGYAHGIGLSGKEPSSVTINARIACLSSFYRFLIRTGLRPAGVHIFRHSAARLRREAGESIEQVSRFLDHSSLAVTTVYLRQLEGDRDTAWEQVAENLGLTSGSNCA